MAGASSGALDGDDRLVTERVRYVVAALRANARCARNVEIVSAEKSPLSTPGSRGDQVEVIIMLP